MKTICAWCACHGRKPQLLAEGVPGGPVSHGICRTCARDLAQDDGSSITGLVGRVLVQFVLMPGLLLSFSQAQRMLGVDAETCSHVMQRLIDAEVVQQIGGDTYEHCGQA